MPFKKLALASLVFSIANAAAADEFKQQLEHILDNHSLMIMVDADVETAREKLNSSKMEWAPTFNIDAMTGYQEIDKELGVSGKYNPYEVEFGIKQLVSDFGLTNSRIDVAASVYSKEIRENELQEQNLILAVVEAQLEALKYYSLLESAKSTELFVSEQVALEQKRVELGKGSSTELLKSRGTLASAKASRIFAQGQLNSAANRYEAVFLKPMPGLSALTNLPYPESALPKSLKQVEALIKSNNPDLLAAKGRSEVAFNEMRVVRNDYYKPVVSFELGKSFSEEIDGALGTREDLKAMLRFHWDFNLGLQGDREVAAATAASLSVSEKAKYVELQALETGRNTWNSFVLNKEKIGFLEEQRAIQSEVVELLKTQKALGKGTAAGVIEAETQLLKVDADLMAARIEQTISAYRLLRSVGRLDLALF